MSMIPFREKYFIHIVNESNFHEKKRLLSTLSICDPAFLSNSFEKLSYLSLDSENNVGYFLTDHQKVYASAIFDLDCAINETAIEEHHYDLREAIELTMLCANKDVRVRGLTTEFMNYVILQLIPSQFPEKKYIFLFVAKNIENNPKAFQFYQHVGFNLMPSSKTLMVYDMTKTGGYRRKSRRTSRHRKRRQTKRRKTKQRQICS